MTVVISLPFFDCRKVFTPYIEQKTRFSVGTQSPWLISLFCRHFPSLFIHPTPLMKTSQTQGFHWFVKTLHSDNIMSKSEEHTSDQAKDGLKKGPWSAEEDQKLIDYINKNGYGRWRTLPENAGIYIYQLIDCFINPDYIIIHNLLQNRVEKMRKELSASVDKLSSSWH